ncbi:CoA-disulfide reductase [Sphaerochaeta halotolerans]|jgi:NADPH-dependent 2,4-dienoyl-CoA reductase/sulfur reductase-like enzyme/rhodanese-related sulfurtransferase|uniref:CoA-disulfide reductase n=1 Tax=Sphaerochaeta halotolerans TaxID=2293840 RepID=A0A372MEW8_9SPIR|nr:FAD-dependent oxidoreductase [Sphaerochaeta halotolerans]RFU94327.1 CoA-disulfide reductase [Sphaerochaeta halotolerans]
MKNVLIIGGVAAGATAAARARRLDNDVNITLLEAGADVSFANCGLPYFLGRDIEYRSSLILASEETFHEQYRVKVHTHTEAIAIDREKKQVKALNTGTGEEFVFPYDSLILAQGGKPVVPPLPGVNKEHVFQLWTLADMDRIDHYISEKEPKKAVVVGGGFIGLEMVEALTKRGIAVTLVEMAPQVMPNLEGEFAGFITKELLDYGVKLKLGKSVEVIEDTKVILNDGSTIDTDFVLLSVGVRPTLQLAKDAGLDMGSSGGLKVNDQMCTSDPSIFAAGDMVEISHNVLGKNVRMPLAGPANRQGRIVGENALGGSRTYKGVSGTSVVKVFEAVAGSTGLSLKASRDAGIDADAVVVHKASHTAYFPGSEKVSLMLIFDKKSKKVLGAQVAGRVGVDKRIDVIATAIAGELTLEDLAELDLAYAPPFNSPNGPVNMAAFTAINHDSGFSPSVLAQDFEHFVMEMQPIAIDLRDPISYGKANLRGTNNLSQDMIRENLDKIPRENPIILISDDGQKGHVVLRMLKGAGFDRVFYVSGGYISLERHARAIGFQYLQVGKFPIVKKSVEDSKQTKAEEKADETETLDSDGPIILDVRTPMEFEMGAYPGAINVGLDSLQEWAEGIEDKDREIIIYCASGARSSYGMRILNQMGFTNVENGGGLHTMMARG